MPPRPKTKGKSKRGKSRKAARAEKAELERIQAEQRAAEAAAKAAELAERKAAEEAAQRERDRVRLEDERATHQSFKDARNSLISEILRARDAEREWEDYLACSEHLNVSDVRAVNAELSLWDISTDISNPDVPAAKIASMGPVFESLDRLRAEKADNPQVQEYVTETRHRFVTKLLEQLDALTVHYLVRAHEYYTDTSVPYLTIERAAGNAALDLGLWMNLGHNASRLTSIDFPDMGASVILPKEGSAQSLVYANIGLRLLRVLEAPPQLSLTDFIQVGPVYLLELLQLPEALKKVAGWGIREITAPFKRPVPIDYPSKVTAKRRPGKRSGSRTGSRAASRQRTGSIAPRRVSSRPSSAAPPAPSPPIDDVDIEPGTLTGTPTPAPRAEEEVITDYPISITGERPALFEEQPLGTWRSPTLTVARWDEKSSEWSTDGVAIVPTPLTGKLTVQTMKCGWLACLAERTQLFPYRYWWISPQTTSDLQPQTPRGTPRDSHQVFQDLPLTVRVGIGLNGFDLEKFAADPDSQHDHVIEFDISGAGVSLASPVDDSSPLKVLKEPQLPFSLLSKLSDFGVCLMPTDRDVQHILQLHEMPERPAEAVSMAIDLLSIGAMSFAAHPSPLNSQLSDFSGLVFEIAALESGEDWMSVEPQYLGAHVELISPKVEVEVEPTRTKATRKRDEPRRRARKIVLPPMPQFRWRVVQLTDWDMRMTGCEPGHKTSPDSYDASLPHELESHTSPIPILTSLAGPIPYPPLPPELLAELPPEDVPPPPREPDRDLVERCEEAPVFLVKHLRQFLEYIRLFELTFNERLYRVVEIEPQADDETISSTPVL